MKDCCGAVAPRARWRRTETSSNDAHRPEPACEYAEKRTSIRRQRNGDWRRSSCRFYHSQLPTQRTAAILPCKGMTCHSAFPVAFLNLPVPPTFFQVPFDPSPPSLIASSFNTSPSLSLRAQNTRASVFPSGFVRKLPIHSPDTRWFGALGSSFTVTLVILSVASVVPQLALRTELPLLGQLATVEWHITETLRRRHSSGKPAFQTFNFTGITKDIRSR